MNQEEWDRDWGWRLDLPETKTCDTCWNKVDLTSFGFSRNGAYGRAETCSDCKHDQHLQARFGITRAQYLAMMDDFGGGCAICHRDQRPDEKNFPVDHAHDRECGHARGGYGCPECVRAVICHGCNRIVGALELGQSRMSFMPEDVVRCIDYVKAHDDFGDHITELHLALRRYTEELDLHNLMGI